jgi:hypothetical protein
MTRRFGFKGASGSNEQQRPSDMTAGLSFYTAMHLLAVALGQEWPLALTLMADINIRIFRTTRVKVQRVKVETWNES